MSLKNPNIVFFGSSRFSEYVLDELKNADFFPVLDIRSAKEPLPSLDELRSLEPDLFVVASFGKILPKDLIELPKFKTLNVHPSMLPELRGPAPIQNLILGKGGQAGSRPVVGVTIMRMDEKMDHGPIVAQEKVEVAPWPDHYDIVEEKLGRAGGRLLAEVIPSWLENLLPEKEQDESGATFVKMIKKEDGLLDLADSPEENLRKVLAYSTWPGAHFIFKKKTGDEVRIVVKDAEIRDGAFTPTRVIPAGKKEMVWQDFLRGNS